MTERREPDDRPDPIEGILHVTGEAESRAREHDRLLGQQLVVGRAYLLSAVLLVALAAALALPHSQGVTGFDVLFGTDVARAQETSAPSRVFVTIYSAGTILFGAVMVLTQRWWAAGIAWCASCVATVYGVLAIWLRQSGRGPNPDFVGFGGPGAGIYLSEILCLALAIVLGVVLWSKTPEQRDLEARTRGGGD